MSDILPQPQIPRQDAYLLARLIAGQSWDDLPASPMARALASNLAKSKNPEIDAKKMLGREWMMAILSEDPVGPPPGKVATPSEVPTLPRIAQLSDEAIRQSKTVGGWLDDATKWAVARSPMTPPIFLEAGMIWAAGLAIARRVHMHVHEPIYPHLYMLWVARTSIFKKTTGMSAIVDLVNAAMPHMLMANDYSPESFLSALAGQPPENYDKLTAAQRALLEKARPHAGRGGIMLDEASSMFGARKKDYMQGQTEMLLRLYDAMPSFSRDIRSMGMITINYPAISILGATTPTALARNSSQDDWETGMFARFAMLYPDRLLDYKTSTLSEKEYQPPKSIVQRLANLHTKLPSPPEMAAVDSGESPKPISLACIAGPGMMEAYQTYSKTLSFDMLLDTTVTESVQPNYSRLPTMALKIAIILATLDWADNTTTDKDSFGVLNAPNIVITLGHWARAQMIAESWRSSLHRLLSSISETDDARSEKRLIQHLTRWKEGRTINELVNSTGLSRTHLKSAIDSLVESGELEVVKVAGKRGPQATIYRLPGEQTT